MVAFLANLRYTYPWPTGPDETRAQTRGRGTEIETAAQNALVVAAQAGDQMAFETLVGAYRRELLVHCYRMLGSFHDAEDLVQETLLRAWEKRTTLTSPGAYRGWLYRIATNLCLDRQRRAPRRSFPPDTPPTSDPSAPVPPLLLEPTWLEPFPHDLLPAPRCLARHRSAVSRAAPPSAPCFPPPVSHPAANDARCPGAPMGVRVSGCSNGGPGYTASTFLTSWSRVWRESRFPPSSGSWIWR